MMSIPVICPYCSAHADRQSNFFEDRSPGPSEGDISLCFKCGSLAIFSYDMSLREPTPDEYVEFTKDDRVLKLLRAWSKSHCEMQT